VISSNENIEEEVLGRINVEKIISLKYDMPFEMSCVYELKINRFTNIEISELLDIPKMRVEKHIYRIRNIVKNKYRLLS
jgi:hypothetical protein